MAIHIPTVFNDRMPLLLLHIHIEYTDDLDLITVAKESVQRHDRTKYFGKY